jgi:hypothetical protein
MIVYALKTTLRPTPERAALGAPCTGWVHESQPPWRVIVWESEDDAPHPPQCEVAIYTGTEATVRWNELTPKEPASMRLTPSMRMTLIYQAGPNERFAPDAFDAQVGKHVPVTANGVQVLGTVTEVKVVEDGSAVEMTVEIPGTSDGNWILNDARRGRIPAMSFHFHFRDASVERLEWNDPPVVPALPDEAGGEGGGGEVPSGGGPVDGGTGGGEAAQGAGGSGG